MGKSFRGVDPHFLINFPTAYDPSLCLKINSVVRKVVLDIDLLYDRSLNCLNNLVKFVCNLLWCLLFGMLMVRNLLFDAQVSSFNPFSPRVFPS